MRNLELKFRCADLDAVRDRARCLGARDAGVLYQHDTFFPAPLGRLKLRDSGDGCGELIAYRRPDAVEARGSDYLLAPTTDPAALRDALRFGLGSAGEVKKTGTCSSGTTPAFIWMRWKGWAASLSWRP